MTRDNSPTESAKTSTIALHDILESSRSITDTAADAIITIDENSRILFVNNAAVEIFGYTIEEMLHGDLTMLMPEYLRHLHRSGFADYVASGKKHISWAAVELPGLHKSGKEVALELSFAEFRKDGQRFFTGIARDITRRKQTEHRLLALQKITDSTLAHLSLDRLLPESLKRIREVLNVDTVAILLLRTEGDELVAWAAQGLEEEVELGVHIPVGVGFAGRIVAQGKPIVIDDISQADVFNPLLREKGIKSLLGVPLVVEGRPIGVLHVGSLKFAKFSEEDVHLLQLAADRIALAVENARLYQVEKTARAAAEDANRAKDEFLTILSHELRTPLTPIIGWVHMMEKGILPDAEFTRALSTINRNAYSLKRLINDLLDMSAIVSGKMRLDESYLSVADVLSEAVETMRSYAREQGVRIKVENHAQGIPLTIKGDRSRLNQSFCNILHNAIKFSPGGGAIRIEFFATDSEAIVGIVDRGDGIPAEFLPHVFERFRQADGSRTRAYGGLGLGLALVKSFMSAHGGTVEATSEGEGKGSTFVVKLPRATPPEADIVKRDQQPEVEQEATSRRLLIVEDQPDTLEMLSQHFRARGYETLACTSATEALDRAQREQFDLLISDIAMPEMDGLELIRILRRQLATRNTPAIALTGYASTKDAETAIAAGFNIHLSKPIDPAELSAAVESLLSTAPSL
ncbi:MAG TPA: response regulator [Pyrinomonadaceae bacterium]|nr:response regulator [Pyrinomonadaceae bacterium]